MVAGVGDSDAVLGDCGEGGDGWKAVQLNRRHVLTDSDEQMRMKGELTLREKGGGERSCGH